MLKNPKLLIPAIVVGAGLAAWGAVDMVKDGVFTKDLNEIGSKKTIDAANAEQREKGGLVNSGKPYIVGEKGPELFTPGSSGNIVPNNRLGVGGGTINITVNGALDAEGTARQIVDILNRATARGGSGSGALVYP